MSIGTASFSGYVEARLSNAAIPGLNRYIVVDQAALFGLHVVAELRWTGVAIDLLHQRSPEWNASASPVLIEAPANPLSLTQSSAWRQLAERWRYANAFTYLEHPASPTDLAGALSERSKATLPDDMEVLLRWYDNRVLAVLLQVLDGDQQYELLRDMCHIAMADRRGYVCKVSAKAQTSYISNRQLKLSSSQEAMLIEAAEPDALINLLLNQQQSTLIAMLPPEQYDCVLKLWRAARVYGIEQVSDQVAFCHLGLELGESFHLLQPWSTVVQEAVNDRGRLVDALAQMERLTA